MQETNAIQGKARSYSRHVFYTGTDALQTGETVVYVASYTTSALAATDSDGNRNQRVSRPTLALNSNFAGTVLDGPYLPNALGQWVKIALPGSVAPVVVFTATAQNVGRVTFVAQPNLVGAVGVGTGLGLAGRGSFRPLQTTPVASVTSAPGPILGITAGTYATSTKTLTATLTNAAVGDKVVV